MTALRLALWRQPDLPDTAVERLLAGGDRCRAALPERSTVDQAPI
jgi:hypothetical protein